MKILSSLLIGLQFGSASLAMASPTSAGVTPEAVLVASAYAMQGLSLSQENQSATLRTSVEQYAASSTGESDTDREANLKTALVDLGVYSDSQAESILHESKSVSVSDQNSVATQVANIVSSHPKGAEFSACASSTEQMNEGILATAGVVVGVLGAVLNFGYKCPAGATMTSTTVFDDGAYEAQSCIPNGEAPVIPGSNVYANSVGKLRSTAGVVTMSAGFGTTLAIGLLAIIQAENCHQ